MSTNQNTTNTPAEEVYSFDAATGYFFFGDNVVCRISNAGVNWLECQQKLSEHAALVAVAEAVNNIGAEIFLALSVKGLDGNAIQIQEALANLAAIRNRK